MPKRTINSFARTNNVNPSKDAACLKKRKKRDAEFTGKVSMGRKINVPVAKKAGINNQKMDMHRSEASRPCCKIKQTIRRQSNQKPINFFAHE